MSAGASGAATSHPPAWHALSADAALEALGSDDAVGLAASEVEARIERFGPNALQESGRRSLALMFLRQFQSPLIYLLFAAAAIAFALGEHADAVVVIVVVMLNALIGTFQEGRAERSLSALRHLASLHARVLRDGHEVSVEAGDVVPGDILLLAAGDAVAADARVIECAAFEVAEAALTGESLPVAKSAEAIAPDAPLADRHCMIFAGTHATGGRARAVVVATGTGTEIGRIAHLAESAEEPMTPLERRIAGFGRFLVVAAIALVAIVLAVGLLRGLSFAEILMVAISQMVSMVPEGLPVAMTIALAVGVQRMASQGAIVRRLAAVETLGSTSVICSDKTGTLTRNEMTVTRVILPGGRDLEVTGVGYAPEGRLEEGGRPIGAADDAALRTLLEAAALCNDSQLLPSEGDEGWRALGDPTEAALLVLAAKGGVAVEGLRTQCPRRAELPFDSVAKMMATLHDTPRGPRIFVKGAPEVVQALCHAARQGDRTVPFDAASRAELEQAVERMGAAALRVLALAEIEPASADLRGGFDALRGHATLLGIIGQIDPPRPEVAAAVRDCNAAGIRPVMVTGDHKATGLAIAEALGIARPGDQAVDGRELDALADAELDARLDRISVFARVRPEQKLRIVAAYQRRGDVVAMTGDGVNDAPALASADVGVAMGITGTEVAKQASKIIVTDDNFATIVGAVAEGRLIYHNVQRLLLYLFSTSAAGVLVLMVALLVGYPPPLAAVQILFINLVTDGAVGVNLVMNPREGDELRRAPVRRGEPLLTRLMISRMALAVPAMALSTLGWFVARLAADVPFETVRSETFTLLAVCQWFNALNCASERRSAFEIGFANRWLLGGLALGNLAQIAVIFWSPLGHVFHTVPIDLALVPAIGVVASLVLWVEEARKLVVRRRERAAAVGAGGR